MNLIEEQKQIIEKLYWLAKISLDGLYDTAELWLDYRRYDDGSSYIGGRLSYTWEGEKKYAIVRYPDSEILNEIIPRLHALMKSHTGGVWESLTLTIDKDGKVSTKFHYPDAGAPPIEA